MVRWEALALTLAADTGIEVPKWRLVPQNGTAVLLLNRFDRRGKRRIPFLSIRTYMTSRAGSIGSRLMSGARRSARHHSTMTVGGSLPDPERFSGTTTACCPAIGRASYAFSYISLPSVKRNHPLATR